MAKSMNAGVARLLILCAVCWLAGMGWYQLQILPSQQKKEGIHISLGDESEIHIDSSGIKQTDKQEVRMEKLAIITLPALLILLLIPVYGWVAAGFSAKGNNQ
ncbi:MAG: hypothetical protein AB7F82_09325 [Alphaproteobacteria bacterium]